MAEIWTIKRCLDWTRDYLKDKGEDRARFAAEWMLSSVTGLSRIELYMSHDKPLSADELNLMHSYVVRRRKGEPLQYITGDTQFRTLQIACEPGVLIPRPETELLVEEVLNFLDAEVLGPEMTRRRVELPWNAELDAAIKAEAAARSAAAASAVGDGADDLADDAGGAASGDEDSGDAFAELADAAVAAADRAEAAAAEARNARVLEIGCGTGCISLSIAAERPGRVACVATDIEPQAVALAMRNRGALGIDPVDADFRLGDLVSPVAPDERGSFDVLVSNPPYIPEAVMKTIPAEVSQYEPRTALASGVDGLDMFRRIVTVAPHMLRPGGLLACELYEESLDEAADICRSVGMQDVRVVNDLAGRPRIILARVA